MENTKAISPEIKGLFDTVRKQAEEYSSAFSQIELSLSLLNRERNEVKKLSKDLRLQVDKGIESLRDTVSDIMESVNDKADKAVKTINDLDKIEETLRQLNSLRGNLDAKEEQLDNIIQKSSELLNTEVDNLINTAKEEIHSHLVREIEALETKILMRQKQLDSRIINFEKKILNITDHNKQNFNELIKEVDEFKQVVTRSVTADLMEIKLQNGEAEHDKDRLMFQKNISARVDDISQKHKLLKDMFENWSILNNFDIKELEKINQIKNKVNTLEEENQKLSKKANYSLMAASFSFILLIILIFTLL